MAQAPVRAPVPLGCQRREILAFDLPGPGPPVTLSLAPLPSRLPSDDYLRLDPNPLVGGVRLFSGCPILTQAHGLAMRQAQVGSKSGEVAYGDDRPDRIRADTTHASPPRYVSFKTPVGRLRRSTCPSAIIGAFRRVVRASLVHRLTATDGMGAKPRGRAATPPDSSRGDYCSARSGGSQRRVAASEALGGCVHSNFEG
jgi:hypothetical protein